VINIVTIAGIGKPTFTGSVETTAPFAVINNQVHDVQNTVRDSYWHGDFSGSGSNNRVSYLVNGGYRTVGNYLMNDSAISRKGEIVVPKNVENHDYSDVRLFGKLGINLTEKISFDLNGRFFDSELGFGKTRNLPDSLDIITTGKKWIINPSMQLTPSANIAIHTGMYYRGMVGEFFNEEPTESGVSVRSYWKSKMNDWQIESQVIFSVGDNHVITGGGDILKNHITYGSKTDLSKTVIPGTDSSDAGILNGGIFVQDEWEIRENLTIVPASRIDFHSEFGTAISPKLGVMVKPWDKIRFLGSAGRAFRAPTLTELYMPRTMINPTFTIVANPLLKPEYLWAFDATAEIRPWTNVQFQIGGFYNNIRDLIGQSVDVSDLNNPRVTHKNIAEAWSRGIELSGESRPVSWLTLTGNMVVQNSRDKNATSIARYFKVIDSLVPLDNIPSMTADLGIATRHTIKKITIDFSVQEGFVGDRSYQDWSAVDISNSDQVEIIIGGKEPKVTINPPRIELDAYFRTDMALKLTFPRELWCAVAFQNLFDAQFEEYGGTRAPGRFATIKVGGKISVK